MLRVQIETGSAQLLYFEGDGFFHEGHSLRLVPDGSYGAFLVTENWMGSSNAPFDWPRVPYPLPNDRDIVASYEVVRAVEQEVRTDIEAHFGKKDYHDWLTTFNARQLTDYAEKKVKELLADALDGRKQ